MRQPPSAPRKTPRSRGWILIDTREDLLDSYNAEDEIIIRTYSEYNTAAAFQDRAITTHTVPTMKTDAQSAATTRTAGKQNVTERISLKFHMFLIKLSVRGYKLMT